MSESTITWNNLSTSLKVVSLVAALQGPVVAYAVSCSEPAEKPLPVKTEVLTTAGPDLNCIIHDVKYSKKTKKNLPPPVSFSCGQYTFQVLEFEESDFWDHGIPLASSPGKLGCRVIDDRLVCFQLVPDPVFEHATNRRSFIATYSKIVPAQ